MVGIAGGRSPPPSLGIITRLTGPRAPGLYAVAQLLLSKIEFHRLEHPILGSLQLKNSPKLLKVIGLAVRQNSIGTYSILQES
jgi:hypothetical protein